MYRNNSIDWEDGYPILFMRMNYSVGTGRINSLSEQINLLLSHFKEPVGWRFFLPNTEKLCLVEIQKYVVKVFLRNPCPPWTWIGYLTDGHGPVCIFNKNRVSLYARARILFIRHFQFNHFIFLFEKKQNSNYNFFFTLSRFLLYPCRLGWFDGNERCAISTAGS